ncbi:hypothetical protein LTR94_025704, partial [Friedmanniomyces endolithicus]
MRYRPFGVSGAAISNLTLSFGSDSLARGREAGLDLLYSALELGVNSYRLETPDPVAAEVLGEALSHVDRNLVSVGLTLGVGASREADRDFSVQGMTAAIDRALHFSDLGWIDVAVLQEPGEHELPQSSLSALKAMRATGRIKLLGVAGGGEVMDAYVSTGAFDALLTPFDINADWKVRNRIRSARDQDMVVFAYDYYADRRGSRREPEQAAKRGLFGLGAKRAKTPTQQDAFGFLYTTPRWTAEAICLTYVLTDPTISSVIVKATDTDQLEMLAATPERDMPPGLAAQIEMARANTVTDTVQAADPVHAFIAQTVAEHDVVLFMKGTPDSPRCGFSSVTVQILDHVGAAFVGVDVLQDEALREGIKAFTDWPTIPQLYVKGEFVGGSDI